MSGSIPFDQQSILVEAEDLRLAVRKAGLFKDPYALQLVYQSFKSEDNNVLVLTYRYLDNNTYCRAIYQMEPRLFPNPPILMVDISYVASSIGKGTGTFLLYLQLLLAYRVQAAVVKLNNSAGSTPENAVRALYGIYRWFNFNTRTKSNSNLALMNEIQKNMTLSNQNKKSRILQEVAGGDLWFDVSKFSYVTWLEHVSSLRTNEEDPNSPWMAPINERFQSLVRHYEPLERVSISYEIKSSKPKKSIVKKTEKPYSRPPTKKGGRLSNKKKTHTRRHKRITVV